VLPATPVAAHRLAPVPCARCNRLQARCDAQLDALEERGYLDPDRLGDRADESEAVEMFLMDALIKR